MLLLTTCSICKGFGRVHPRLTDKVDYSRLVYCHCQGGAFGERQGKPASRLLPPPEPDHYTEITPTDFDYPCSDTFRGYYFERYAGHDPGRQVPSSMNEPSKSTPLIEDMPPDSRRIDQLEGNLISLRDALKQHVNESRPSKRKDRI